MAFTVFADRSGKIYDHPELELSGQSGRQWIRIPESELIPLPEGSKLFTMPGRAAVGWDPKTAAYSVFNGWKSLDENQGIKPHQAHSGSFTAVAAFLPAGYTRLYLPAVSVEKPKPYLPLWTYTSVGWTEQGFCAPAVRIDPMTHSEPCHYDDREIIKHVEKRIAMDPGNRLLRHLKRCALSDHCFAAKNLFMGRWEAPLPTSPSCNASCAGCLSLQPENGCAASQDRIDFVPTPDEVVRTALPHLKHVKQGIVSFGQGCEGEPLLQSALLCKSIRRMRQETELGTIHLNTNGFSPQSVKGLRKSGLDSIRISLNSPREETYQAYYRPKAYRFRDVIRSIGTAVDSGLYTAINLLVFPGITDLEPEAAALLDLIRKTRVQMIQMRNLSIDPEIYLNLFPSLSGRAIGILNLIRLLRKEFPQMEIGYFNRPRELFKKQLVRELTI